MKRLVLHRLNGVSSIEGLFDPTQHTLSTFVRMTDLEGTSIFAALVKVTPRTVQYQELTEAYA